MAKYTRVVTKNEEPVWVSDKEATQAQLIRAFNWYNENKNESDASKYLGVGASIARRFTTLAWAKRMLSRDCVFPEVSKQHVESLEQELNDFIAAEKRAAAKKAEGISIQERVDAKAESFISELEGFVDEFGIDGKAQDMNAYQWMIDNGVKAIHSNKIAEHFRKCAIEPLKAFDKKDKYLVEAYEKMGKARLQNLIICYSKIVSDAERIGKNQKATRKPRAKKAVSHEKVVSKLQYQKKDDTLKIQSVNPVSIIGAQQVWVYNTKTRKLGVYHALDTVGILVKGTTLDNYSSKSISKNLRKPEQVLPKVLESGKIALRKILDDVNSKAIALNGRINKDTVILRVVN